MSLLTPLYIAGLIALSLPLLFHLIRRAPQGELPYSSLMFLEPSPPRLTRRSKLDHLLLLLLRALALGLLALAFARPFLRQAAFLQTGDDPPRRIAILLDTSASMQRAGLWTAAKEKVEAALRETRPADRVALFTFGDDVQTLVSLEESGNTEPSQRAALVRTRLKNVAPSWGSTDLGGALVMAADALHVSRDDEESTSAAGERQIIVVSDMQQGSNLEAVERYEWPREVQVALESVKPKRSSNAGLRLLTSGDDANADEMEPRVRVANVNESALEQFELAWQTSDGRTVGNTVSVYVPKGQSRVVGAPRPVDTKVDRLVLRGDDHDFDNTFYVAPLRQAEVSIAYVGNEAADDPQGMHFYLIHAFPETPRRKVTVSAVAPDEQLLASDATPPHLIVVAEPLPAERVEELKQYLLRGGAALLVMKNEKSEQTLATLLEQEQLTAEEAPSQDYVMLSQIDFSHPVFASLAGPRFNDFTRIRFWKHRRLKIDDTPDVRVVARFDNGDPALVERRFERGRLLTLTSGWHPDDSQLARSTKFVPMLSSLLEQHGGGESALTSYEVGQRIDFGSGTAQKGPQQIIKPGGDVNSLAANTSSYDAADRPGIYEAVYAPDDARRFAVNLSADESNTAALESHQLEQFGVRLGRQLTLAEQAERDRQLRDTELETRQKLWRWLIAAAVFVLIVETWLAGRLSRAENRQGRSDD